MRLAYSKDGTIIAVYRDEVPVKGDALDVNDDDVEDDFLKTFALGKYRVEGENLVKVKGFRRRKQESLEDLVLEPPKRNHKA